MREISVAGPPRARGRAHGEELRDQIAAGLERWQEGLAVTVARDGAVAEYLRAFLAMGSFRDAARRWTPDVLDEVEGIAEGAGADPDLVWAYQLMDEQWWFSERWQGGADASTAERCSSLALRTPTDTTVVAQNMDLPAVYDGQQVLLRVHDERTGTTALLLTAAGLIGFCGCNDRGVAVCCNSLPTLPVCADGLPVAFVLRGVLERGSRASAVEFLRTVRHATGQNYVVGDPDGFADLECGGDDVAPHTGGPRCVFHTNHPLAWTGPETERPAPPSGAPIPRSSSHDRFATLANRLEGIDAETTPTVAEIQALLATPPVSVARTESTATMTIGSLVAELGPEPVAHVAPGPPATTPYETFPL